MRPFGRTLILGHRGAPEQAPENTMRAFEAARRAGADGVELDVQISADRVPIVIHDDTLDRTTSGSGPVAGYTADRLRQLRAGGEPIPMLEEVARWAYGSGAWLNVEIKAEGIVRETIAVLRAVGLGERVVISSFDGATVADVRRLAPDYRAYLLVEEWNAAALARARLTGAQGVCLGTRAADALAIEALHREGLPVVVWTANEGPEIATLLRAGVAAVITNRPALAVQLREEIED